MNTLGAWVWRSELYQKADKCTSKCTFEIVTVS
nr:MAG TPA: hypothetical protein [Caudoviricetes sp.]